MTRRGCSRSNASTSRIRLGSWSTTPRLSLRSVSLCRDRRSLAWGRARWRIRAGTWAFRTILALPNYQGFAPGGVGPAVPLVGFGDHVTEVYDRIPKDSSEIRRESVVSSADGHGLGRIDGFVVDAAGAVTHLVLERGHLWGKRDVSIPIGAVKTITTDEVQLSISKDDVGELPLLSINRPS